MIFPRRSLSLPIVLAIVMIVLLVVLTIGWVLLNVFSALKDDELAGVFWALLSIGTTFILMLLAGVIIYLVLSVKAINLNHRQSNFIDSVTHELKSPIASMKLALQTLSRRQLSREEQSNFHRFMMEDLDRLDLLINQLLDAGRLEADRQHGEVEDVELGALLSDCAKTICFRHRVPEETVQLRLEPCTVRARRLDLDLVFRNLIDNAVKYAGKEPQVEVSLRRAAKTRVIIAVSDNGRGVPFKHRRKIFGRFQRLGSELEREKPGTGLGLYIVHTLVKRLGGRIRVRDRQGGSGAVFEVQLEGPLVIAPMEPVLQPNPVTSA